VGVVVVCRGGWVGVVLRGVEGLEEAGAWRDGQGLDVCGQKCSREKRRERMEREKKLLKMTEN